MAYIEYYQNNFTLSLKKVIPQTTSFIIPLNTDTLLIMHSNNEYQIYRIRSSQLIYHGQIPKQFYISQYIKPLTNFKEQSIFFYNGAEICKLKYKQNIVDTHVLDLPGLKLTKNITIDYRILDQFGLYLAIWVKNTENMSCAFLVYDWNSKSYSNMIHLGQSFFNLKITNFTQKIDFSYENIQSKNTGVTFVVVTDEDKKICYNHLQLSMKQIITEMQDPQKKKFQLILKEAGKKVVNFTTDQIVMFSFFNFPYLYVGVNNSKQGPTIYSINIQQNSHRRIQITTKIQNQKGLIRKFLGYLDDNLIFTIHSIYAKTQEIYKVSTKQLIQLGPNINKIPANKLLLIQNDKNFAGISKIADVQRSIDGYSLVKYNFQLEKIIKLCMKQNPQFQAKLKVQVIYRIPKKYFYYQIAENLQLSQNLTYEILRLL